MMPTLLSCLDHASRMDHERFVLMVNQFVRQILSQLRGPSMSRKEYVVLVVVYLGSDDADILFGP